MNNRKAIRCAALLAAIALPTGAAWADSVNMTVSATVAAGCKMTSVPAMAFGTLDQILAPNVTVPVTVSYKCTVGTTPTAFTVGGATAAPAAAGTFNGTMASGANNMNYTIGWTGPTLSAGTGVGSAGTATSVTLTGSLLGATYANSPVGSYTQSVAIAVTP
jgi:spore coat protein U-like protein